MKTLSGRTAVVTGAASGIGEALARRLVGEGMYVVLVDRDEAGLHRVASELGSERASVAAFDVTSTQGWEDLAARLATQPPSLLIHAAGLTVHGPFASHSAVDLERVVRVDLLAPMIGCRAFHALLTAQDEAHIVLVSSLAAFLPVPLQASYSAAKAGLRAFGAALRIELSSTQVGLTVVMPGTVATPFLHHAQSHHEATSSWMSTSMLRWGLSPDRVATRILRAVLRNRSELVIGADAQAVRCLNAVCPALVPTLLRWGWWWTRPDQVGPA